MGEEKKNREMDRSLRMGGGKLRRLGSQLDRLDRGMNGRRANGNVERSRACRCS